MNGKSILPAALSALCFFSALHIAPAQDEKDDINWRFLENDDGSRTEFHRLGDNRTLIKRNFSRSGQLQMVSVYTMDRRGNSITCDIYNGGKEKLYWVSYGYDRVTGLVAEEQMFDAQIKRTDPNTGDEMPVRRFIYTYDAQGEQQRPIALTLIPGLMAEQLFKERGSALQNNPFADDFQPDAR